MEPEGQTLRPQSFIPTTVDMSNPFQCPLVCTTISIIIAKVKGMHLFIHVLNKSLLSLHYVSGTLPSDIDSIGNKQDLWPHRIYCIEY